MIDLQKLTQKYEAKLRAAGVLSPLCETHNLLKHFLDNVQVITEDLQFELDKAFEQRAKRIPIERIFKKAAFYGLELSLPDHVYRPYPETEDVIEYALREISDKKAPLRILDLGTGTGCLLLGLLAELPNATGIGIDLDERTINTASANAEANHLSDRAAFRVGDWSKGLNEAFDIILSNPPRVASDDINYLLPEMRDYDPRMALDGGKEGLNYFRLLADDFQSLAKPNAIGVFQVGPKHHLNAQKLFSRNHNLKTYIRRNFAGRPCALVIKYQPKSLVIFMRRPCQLLTRLFALRSRLNSAAFIWGSHSWEKQDVIKT